MGNVREPRLRTRTGCKVDAMRIVAVDPGLRPGVVEICAVTGQVLRAAATIRPSSCPWLWNTPWDFAATESQWYFGKKKGRRPSDRREPDVNDLLKLAFRAGFTLACIPAACSLRIPPQVWRSEWGGPGLTKEQVQKKIVDNLTAVERRVFIDVAASRHGDVLDAIGIAKWVQRNHTDPAALQPYIWSLT